MINLLPWRENLRKKRRLQFIIILLISLILTIVIILIWHLFLASKIKAQKLDNQYIKQQIAALQPKFLYLLKLQQQKQQLLKQSEDIKILQKQDQKTIYLFKELANVVPTGVHLTELNKKNNAITLIGEGDLHTDIVELVENINQSTWFKNPVLQEMQSPKNKFIVKCQLS